MMFEDARKPEGEQLDFVLHLGDFIYELIWYPEDRPQGMYDRRLRDLVRFERGEKVEDFHIPVTLEDYRALYRAWLQDPDLQDARARWPFVCVWDNHEFSWRGWQGFMNVATPRPAQTRKVAANQAWFEYQPARIAKPDGARSLNASSRRRSPMRRSSASTSMASASSRTILRPSAVCSSIVGCSFGRNVDLVLTDNHSFQSRNADGYAGGRCVPEQGRSRIWRPRKSSRFSMQDANTTAGGRRTRSVSAIGNCRMRARARRRRRCWASCRKSGSSSNCAHRARRGRSGATRSARSTGAPIRRICRPGMTTPWPGAGYASLGGGDWSGYLTERAEIFDFVRDNRIAGFAIVSGDRHSFWAGLAAKALPPRKFEPVGVSFITGSISAPGLPESAEHNLSREHPLRSLYVHQTAPDAPVQRTMNMLLMHGVRSCLEFAKSGNYNKALAVSNPEVAPHLSFLDLGGHGYAAVSASDSALDVEFVCIPRPLERSETPDGGPLAYRVVHRARLWKAGETPKLERTLLEGTPPLSI